MLTFQQYYFLKNQFKRKRAGYTPEAFAYFAAVKAAGGTLSKNVKDEFDDFVIREKDAGRWSKLVRLLPYLGGVLDSARVDAVTTNQVLQYNFLDVDVDPLIGLKGDGSSKYLQDFENADVMITSLFDVQMGRFSIGQPDTTAGIYFMGNANGPNYNFLRNISSTVYRVYSGAIGDVVNAGNIQANDSIILGRYSDSSLYGLVNGVLSPENATTITEVMPPFPPLYFRTNGGSGYDATKVGGHFYAQGFSIAETQAFEASYKTFLANIGAI